LITLAGGHIITHELCLLPRVYHTIRINYYDEGQRRGSKSPSHRPREGDGWIVPLVRRRQSGYLRGGNRHCLLCHAFLFCLVSGAVEHARRRVAGGQVRFIGDSSTRQLHCDIKQDAGFIYLSRATAYGGPYHRSGVNGHSYECASPGSADCPGQGPRQDWLASI
jgi:hypothetical protein